MNRPALSFPQFIKALVDHQVDFVVCGGVACFLHGTGRTTMDLDVCVRLEENNLENLVKAVRALGMRPRIPEPLESLLDESRRRDWIEKKNAMVYTLVSNDSPLQMDVFLHYVIPYADLKKRATRMNMDDVPFLASSREDLVTAKRAVQPPRKNDLRDIEDLEDLIRRERAS